MIKKGKSTLSLFRRFAAGAVVAVACSGIAIGQQQQASDYWADWPEASKQAAAEMYEKYGEPDGVTEKMVIWNDAGPWKTTTVYKDPVPHNFSKPHKDVLEQTVNYEVPTDKIDELSAFDGSVFAKRTSGVLGTTCDKEPMNVLTLNLAHDIIVGKKGR